LLGDLDKAVNFPGTGGVAIPWSEDLNPFTAFSVELWARPDPMGTGTDRALFASRTMGSGWHYGYYLGANTTDQWQFNTGHKTSGVTSLLGGGPTNQVWYHLAATFDATTGSKNLYVNGQLAANSIEAEGTFAPNNQVNEGLASDQGIGKTTPSDPYNNEGTYFFGEIDEVAVYNYALAPEQVLRHYGAATAPTLAIARTGNQVSITWSPGRLLQAADLTGPWTVVSAAASPLTLTPSASRQFYRVVLP
jgi:large repetitive protein